MPFFRHAEWYFPGWWPRPPPASILLQPSLLVVNLPTVVVVLSLLTESASAQPDWWYSSTDLFVGMFPQREFIIIYGMFCSPCYRENPFDFIRGCVFFCVVHGHNIYQYLSGTWYLESSRIGTRWSLHPSFMTRYGCSLLRGTIEK